MAHNPKAEQSIFQDPEENPFKSPEDRFLYVIREVHELLWIFNGMKSNPPAGLKSKLHKVVGGADFAALDQNSASRDAQFELRVAAYFSRGGYEVDLSTDTDIIAHSDRATYFVECKRVGSPKLLERRVKDARKQLEKRSLTPDAQKSSFGLTALDVTKVAFSHNGLTFGVTAEHVRDVIRDKLADIGKQIRLVDSIFVNKLHIGVFSQIHIPSLVMNPPQTFTNFSNLMITNRAAGLKGAMALKRFENLLPARVDPSISDTPSKTISPRRGVTFEANTTLAFDQELLEELRATGTTTRRPDDHEVLWMNKAGVELQFFYPELEMVLAAIPPRKLTLMRKDQDLMFKELMGRLYLQRFRWADEPANLVEAKS